MFKTIRDFDFVNKRVLVRCEFDVPVDAQGNILDDFRIQRALPTIEYLTANKAKVILMCHLGRPEGQVMPGLKTDKIAQRLAEYLGFAVVKLDDCVGENIKAQIEMADYGGVLLLENLRFHKEEQDNDLNFAEQLAELGDFYVNDAFGVCHRENASVTGLPQFLPHCAGFSLEKEIQVLSRIMQTPEQPMVVLIGGKKVETKSKFINNISGVADSVIISGLIAKEVLQQGVEFSFPDKIVSPAGDLEALDINDESIKIFSEKILQAKTVLWNGPFGKFEDEQYSAGTLAIAKAIIESGAYSVVGGGETVEFINKKGMIDKFSHVSTGGGAMLSYLAGDVLPGIEALK